jgi:hypothetical protein
MRVIVWLRFVRWPFQLGMTVFVFRLVVGV